MGKITMTLEPLQYRDGDMRTEFYFGHVFCSIILLEW